MSGIVAFSVIVLVAGFLMAGPLLAAPFAARRQPWRALALLLPTLATLGASAGGFGGLFLSIALFGFNLGGKAPWWDRYLSTGGAICGALVGVGATVLLIRRWRRAEAVGLPDQAEDYDDAARPPMTDPPRLMDAGR